MGQRKITLIPASSVRTMAAPHTGPTPLQRLVTAGDYDAAPAGTIVEFDRHPGTLGYLNWDHRWELSADPRPHDHAAATVAEHEGPSTVVRWGR